MRQLAILTLLAIVYAGRGSAAPTPETGKAGAPAAGGGSAAAAAVLARAKEASGGKAWDLGRLAQGEQGGWFRPAQRT